MGNALVKFESMLIHRSGVLVKQHLVRVNWMGNKFIKFKSTQVKIFGLSALGKVKIGWVKDKYNLRARENVLADKQVRCFS